MIISVVLPKWGMGIDECTIVRWLKVVGAKVEKGEPIAEIETAKATQEMEAPATGTLIKILLNQGETAPVSTEVALIESGNE